MSGSPEDGFDEATFEAVKQFVADKKISEVLAAVSFIYARCTGMDDEQATAALLTSAMVWRELAKLSGVGTPEAVH